MDHLCLRLAFPFQRQLFLLTPLFVLRGLPFPAIQKQKVRINCEAFSLFLLLLSTHNLSFTHSFWVSHTQKYTYLLFYLLPHHSHNILTLPMASLLLAHLHAFLIYTVWFVFLHFFLSSINHPPHAKILNSLFFLKENNLSPIPTSFPGSCPLVPFSIPDPVISSFLSIFTWSSHSSIVIMPLALPGLLYIYLFKSVSLTPPQPLETSPDCSS